MNCSTTRSQIYGLGKTRNGFYYYYKIREGGRVRSKYMGKEAYAQLCVRLTQDKQLGRRIDREALHSAQQADAEIDRQLATVEAAISALTNARLTADG